MKMRQVGDVTIFTLEYQDRMDLKNGDTVILTPTIHLEGDNRKYGKLNQLVLSQLFPCPRCDSTNIEFIDNEPSWSTIVCKSCKLRVSGRAMGGPVRDPVNKWNFHELRIKKVL
jgi:hypothetical protein